RPPLLLSSCRISLKGGPRRSPNPFFQLPFHSNPRVFAEPIHKRLSPSGSANQLRVDHARNDQSVLAPGRVQRLSCCLMQRIACIPKSSDYIGVQRGSHSSSL